MMIVNKLLSDASDATILSITLELSISLLEVSFMVLEDIYITGYSGYDLSMFIV